MGGDAQRGAGGRVNCPSTTACRSECVVFFFAIGVAILAALLISEVTRRMTVTRNDGVAPEQYLIAHNIDVKGIIGKEPAREFGPAHDKEELRFYIMIVFASIVPAGLVWLVFSCTALAGTSAP
jgi:hypothetical protein